jgi:hypothetical protein
MYKESELPENIQERACQSVHTTIGLYNDGSFKVNGVTKDNLPLHINYNKIMRFGRALFVDGKCIYSGYIDDKRIKAFEQRLIDQPLIVICDTQPYH